MKAETMRRTEAIAPSVTTGRRLQLARRPGGYLFLVVLPPPADVRLVCGFGEAAFTTSQAFTANVAKFA